MNPERPESASPAEVSSASSSGRAGAAARASGVAPAVHAPWRERLGLAALAVVSGVLWFLGAPDFDCWPLAWIAMVPTFFAVERARTARQAFCYAWLAGAVGNGGGFYWIVGLLKRFAYMPYVAAIPVFGLMCAYQGLIFAAVGAVARAIRRNAPALPMALVAPLCIVTFELITPVIFPFHVGITQAWQRHVIQIADVTGPLGVSFLLLMVSGAVYDVLTQGRRRTASTAAALGVLGAALGYGHLRIAHFERVRAAAPQLDVGVVQPNIAFDQKGTDRPDFADTQLGELQRQSAALERAGADMILWSETAYPFALPRTLDRDLEAGHPLRIHRGFTAPLVFGAITREPPGEGDAVLPYNSALMLAPDGRLTARFDKTFLMVFGEYTPGRERFPALARLMPATAGHLSRGREVVTMPLRTPAGQTVRVGPMICYEDILSGFGRQLARLHPHLLVNLTNDAWFGDTAEPWEHLALSVYRAVEMRTDLVRAVNTGVSAFVDSTGRVFAKTYAVDPALHPRGADRLLGRVALVEGGHTVFAAVGDLFACLCAGATAFLWLAWPRMRRRRRARAVDPGRTGPAPKRKNP